MEPLQIFFNSFVVVVLLVRFAERIYEHKARTGIVALAFVLITAVNSMFLSTHYAVAEAIARGAAIGTTFVIAGVVFVLVKRRPRSRGQ